MTAPVQPALAAMVISDTISEEVVEEFGVAGVRAGESWYFGFATRFRAINNDLPIGRSRAKVVADVAPAVVGQMPVSASAVQIRTTLRACM